MNVFPRQATFPLALGSAFDGAIEPLGELEYVWIPDVLNNANTNPATGEFAVGFSSKFAIRNDGPAVLRLLREFSMDGATYFSTGGVGVNIAAGTTVFLNEHLLPALLFYRWHLLNLSAVNALTYHAVHTLRATQSFF